MDLTTTAPTPVNPITPSGVLAAALPDVRRMLLLLAAVLGVPVVDPQHIAIEVLTALVKGYLRGRMTDSELHQSIARAMRRKKMTIPNRGLDLVVSDIEFRLWDAVVRSGDVADKLFRDPQRPKVQQLVRARYVAGMKLIDVIRITAEETLNVTF